MKCNLCDSEKFLDFNGRPNAKCAGCGAMERTRMLWMYLMSLDIGPQTRILHVAPERVLYRKLMEIVGPENYVPADIDVDRYSLMDKIRYIDLCDMEEWQDDEFDIILHMHVLEHTPCNIAYTLYHLHRILKPSGNHICVVPFLGGLWDETFQDIGDDERKRRFGQFDHVRRFGSADIESHLGKVIRVPEKFNAEKDFTAEELEAAAIPRKFWRGFHMSTVMMLKKDDYLLGG